MLQDGIKCKACTTKGFLAMSMALNFVLKASGSMKSWRTVKLIGSFERSFHNLV